MIKYLVPQAFLVSVSYCPIAFAHILKRPLFAGRYRFTDPHESVAVFLRAVDGGEMMVFDWQIEASMLVSVCVEFVY